MKKYIVIITLVFAITQTNSTIFAKGLSTKLYEDKETIRGGGKAGDKSSITAGEEEREFFYGNRSGLFPKRGRAYIQYYNQADKVTIIVNSKITADVLLAGVDTNKYYYKPNFYWEVYDRFMINKADLYYVRLGRDKKGMHKVVLFAKSKGYKVNINKWINKYCRIKLIKVVGDRGPVWIYKANRWVEPRWPKIKSMRLTSVKSRKAK